MDNPAPPTKEEYRLEAIQLAFGYAPRIYPCKKCQHPVINGYCCQTCGDGNPSSED